ncbi:MAG: tRNA (adenosine(37)-N6)-threonylcarbamoyltransferase complex transferase subunit TsaD [Ruminococcaceae bacterium]|nr:tRNA (adenosine(37)-N6)-threonylcarbamoyltransferase complex transferase subunit TsaD [Oscillospiraceae bacterium]
MNILAFESSCDETSASVVVREDDRFTIKSNVIASQVDTHRLYGGVVPEIASRAHIEAISSITYEALKEAGLGLSDIDLVAVSANPGLIGALLVGVNFAKALAVSNKIPLVAVDHIKGHIASAYLIENGVPKPPFIALAASGGHTAIYKAESYTDIKMIGTTRDDAIGESFDKIGRMIGIPYPAGRGFDELSRLGFIEATGKDEDFYAAYKKSAAYKNPEMTLPSPALRDSSLDFSFSGLKTAAINLLHRYEQKGIELPRALFAARYTFEAVEAVALKIDMALRENPGCDLIVAGGVAANSHLRKRLAEIAERNRVGIFIPPIGLCGDNGAMIAAAGYYEYLNGNFAGSDLNASAADSMF